MRNRASVDALLQHYNSRSVRGGTDGMCHSDVSVAGSRTLMQQREREMSPDGASGADANGKATGKIQQ